MICTRLFTGRTFYNSEVQFVMKSFLFTLFSTVKVHSIKTCQLIDVNCLPFFSLLCHCYSSINGVNSDYFALIFNQRYHNRCPLSHPYLLIVNIIQVLRIKTVITLCVVGDYHLKLIVGLWYRWVSARKTLLTHWSYVFLVLTHRYGIANLVIIGSSNGLSPVWCQAITWPHVNHA